jgi:pimeloyl-ACP methyl ester carboxylesterase
VVALLLVALLGGCTGGGGPPSPPPSTPSAQPGATVPPSPALAPFYAQRADWKDCGDGFFCATVKVPIDYAQPTAGDLDLALTKLPASEPERRVGSLLVNPGGPGASGLDYARSARQAFTERVRAVYDIVGFDPRGVGASDPIDCVSDQQLDAFTAADGSPDSPAEEAGLLALSKDLADGCAQRSPALVAHVGTVDAARDMDVIRAVLGDARLTYYGASYGTFLGATYAEEFPAKVGRFVLDGVLDPTLTAEAMAEGQLGGFESAFEAFLDDCVSGSGCPVGPTVDEARAQVQGLVAAADAAPLPSRDGRPVTQSLVVIGLLAPLYDQANGWPRLRAALAAALDDDDGSGLLSLADMYYGRNADGTYAGNQNEANLAVNCLDRPDHATLAQTRATAARFAAESPIFGPYFAWSDLPCTVWPAPSTDHPHPIKAAGAAPILVVSTTRDPATPYEWGVSLAGQLESGRLITRDGDGHTGYTRGSACIDDAVDAYLLDGTLPPVGTVCT